MRGGLSIVMPALDAAPTIAAALAADGVSRVGPLGTVERGYANLVSRLKTLGAKVEVERV